MQDLLRCPVQNPPSAWRARRPSHFLAAIGLLAGLASPGVDSAWAQQAASPGETVAIWPTVMHQFLKIEATAIRTAAQGAGFGPYPLLQTNSNQQTTVQRRQPRPLAASPQRPKHVRPVVKKPASTHAVRLPKAGQTTGNTLPGFAIGGSNQGVLQGLLSQLPFSLSAPATPTFKFPSGSSFQTPKPVSTAKPGTPAPKVQVPQPLPQPSPSSASGGGNPYDQQELALINQYRQQNGLGTLSADNRLMSIALGHSQDMANRGSMDHNGFDQRFQQAQQYGYMHCVENVAWNWPSSQDLFNAWQNSPEHNKNMLDPAIRAAGMATVNYYATFFACN